MSDDGGFSPSSDDDAELANALSPHENVFGLSIVDYVDQLEDEAATTMSSRDTAAEDDAVAAALSVASPTAPLKPAMSSELDGDSFFSSAGAEAGPADTSASATETSVEPHSESSARSTPSPGSVRSDPLHGSMKECSCCHRLLGISSFVPRHKPQKKYVCKACQAVKKPKLFAATINKSVTVAELAAEAARTAGPGSDSHHAMYLAVCEWCLTVVNATKWTPDYCTGQSAGRPGCKHDRDAGRARLGDRVPDGAPNLAPDDLVKLQDVVQAFTKRFPPPMAGGGTRKRKRESSSDDEAEARACKRHCDSVVSL